MSLRVKVVKLGLFLVSFVILSLSGSLYAQSQTWKSLEDVQIVTLQKAGYTLDVPKFGSKVKQLDGKIIEIKGYVLPLQLDNENQFFLSKLPYSSCYFCGGAGIETIVEVFAKGKVPYSAYPKVIRGRFRLNSEDPEHLMYILEEAELIP